MKINSEEGRALWFEKGKIIFIDQRKLPYKLEYYTAQTVDDCCFAIKEMAVRGAPAIGAATAYGISRFKFIGKEFIFRIFISPFFKIKVD